MRLKHRKARGRDAGGWLAHCTEPGVARVWLREAGSLTARLHRPLRDETRQLHLAAGQVAPVREVVLRVAGRAAVYAHTVANDAAFKLLRRAGLVRARPAAPPAGPARIVRPRHGTPPGHRGVPALVAGR